MESQPWKCNRCDHSLPEAEIARKEDKGGHSLHTQRRRKIKKNERIPFPKIIVIQMGNISFILSSVVALQLHKLETQVRFLLPSQTGGTGGSVL